MNACRRFRELLADAVAAPRGRVETGELAWHEHLLGCAACRELFEQEEVLEELLAALPEPRLAPELARRVLAALAAARETHDLDGAGERLDALLELDAAPAAPSDLAARVRAGLGGARAEARLDALLDRVPPPPVPGDLAQRVLASLEDERHPTPILRPAFGARRVAIALAAAAVLVVAIALGLRPDEAPTEVATAPEVRRETPTTRVEPLAEPDEELLRSLELLENWELVTSSDLDLLLADIEPLEDVLLLEPADADEEEKG